MSRKIIVKGQAGPGRSLSNSANRPGVINQNGLLGNSGLNDAGFGGGGEGLRWLQRLRGIESFDLASNLVVDMMTVPGENQIVLA